MLKKLKEKINNFRGLRKLGLAVRTGCGIFTSGNWKIGEQLRSYQYSVYVYACVKKRSEKTAQLLEFKLKNKKTGEEIEKDHILDVLEKPNEYQTKNEFFEQYQQYKDLTGKTFIYLVTIGEGKNKKTQEMHNLDPRTMTVQMDKDGTEIVSFEQSDSKTGKSKTYKPEEIIFSIYPNPLQQSIIDGQSPLSAGAKSVDTETQLSDYQYSILKNGGKIEGLITVDTEYLTSEQAKEIQNKFEENYAEAKNSGKPLVMYGKNEYKNLGLTPTELSYLESKKATREDILTIYQVPKTILGITDGVQKGNYEEANAVFIKDTIKPLLINIVNKLNNSELVGDDKELTYIDPIPEDVELNMKKIENGTKNFYMTTNEKRKLVGLEEISGLDEILVPFNLVNLGDDNSFSGTNDPEEKKKCRC